MSKTFAALLVLSLAASLQPASAQEESIGAVVQVTAAQAHRHGLPELDFGFQYGSEMRVKRFPDAQTYVRLESRSGGAPDSVVIRAYQGPNAAPTLRALLQTQVGADPVVFSRPTKLDLAHGERQALSCVSGTGATRVERCAILLPATSSTGAVMVLTLPANGDPDPSRVLRNEHFGLVVHTFHQ